MKSIVEFHNSLVSIITATFNSSDFIKDTIISIINQSYNNWELIITDDFSSDDTVEIVKSFMILDSRIQLFVLNENSGPAVARNNSINKSKGRFIAFCDSDDLWSPIKLEKQIQFITEYNLPFTYSSYQNIDKFNNLGSVILAPKMVTYKDILKYCNIGCLTVIYDRNKIGTNYMPIIRKRQDYGLWLNIIRKIKIVYGMNDVLGYYRIREGSVSSNKFSASFYHLYVLVKIGKQPLYKAFYYFHYYIFNGVTKYFKF